MANFSYEVRTERLKTDTVLFDGNLFERIDSQDSLNQTVRYLADGKLSIASGSKPNSEHELIKQAKEMVKYGSKHNVDFVGAEKTKTMNICDETTLSSEEMIEKASEFVESLKALDNRLTASARLSSSFLDLNLKTTEGFNSGYRKSVWSAGGSIDLMQGEDLLSIYEGVRSLGPNIDLNKLTKKIATTLEYSKEVVPFEAGAYPVIFSTREAGYVLNPILASLNGMAIYRKVSPFTEKLGQQAFDERFTLYDDATEDMVWSSIPFDYEGTPTRRVDLVKSGVLSDILLNRKVGALLGKPSSGNASSAEPAANFVQMDSGSKTLEELIKSIDYGLLIDGSMGAWSGNPFAGIVTGTISLGLKIEKGKIVGRVKDCMFTVSSFEMFKNHFIDCTKEKDETQIMFGASARLPYIALDEVVISAK